MGIQERKVTHHNLDHHTSVSPRKPASAEGVRELGDDRAIDENRGKDNAQFHNNGRPT